MWIDVQLGPWAQRMQRRVLLVWDNCGSHLTAPVIATMKEHHIATEPLPVNMTDLLQPMDLTVNGPLNAAVRRERCRALFFAMQSWRMAHLTVENAELLKPVEERKPIVYAEFNPPKPTIYDGLRTLFKTLTVRFTTPSFRAGLARTFVYVGLAPADAEGRYVNYTRHVERTKAHKTPQAVAIALPDDPKVTDDTFMATDLLPAEFMEELVHKDDDSESSSSESSVSSSE
jgi:hypothetical protein